MSYAVVDESLDESKSLLREDDEEEEEEEGEEVSISSNEFPFSPNDGLTLEDTDEELSREEFLRIDIEMRVKRLDELKRKIENEYNEQQEMLANVEADYEDPTSLNGMIRRRMEFIKRNPFWSFIIVGIIILLILAIIKYSMKANR